MKYFTSLLFISFFISNTPVSLAQPTLTEEVSTSYGTNAQSGHYAEINGIKMYYEEYGQGQPMFLIHGNGGDIKSMGNQIDHFKGKYRVIVADSRGHGKSEMNTDSLTYVQIANDWAALADHLKLDSLLLIGWSDGGIVSLLLGIHHPSKVKKMVTMGANLRPDSSAVHSFAVNWLKEIRPMVEAKISAGDKSKDWNILKQHLGLLGDQPNIPVADLAKIKAPALIMAGDSDIIRVEHSVEIYQNIPNAHLCIMPGETHYTPDSNPALFNKFAEDFFSKPFTRPDSDFTK